MNNKVLFNAAVRNDLGLFIQRAFATVVPGRKYLHNWHIDAIAYALTQVKNGKKKRLIITMPPRHMKSQSTSVAFSAWMLGHHPEMRIINISYSQDLATTFSKDARLVMESDWYRTAFPGTVISDLTNTQAEFATTKQGLRLATSVGGSVTGRGGDILIIDDPHKADEAYSPTKRQQTIDWYFQTAASRLDDPENGIIIVIQQRFHEEDLAGVLLDTGEWEHLNLPAIAQVHEKIAVGPGTYYHRKPGEALHPERMSLEFLKGKEAEVGSLVFAGQYLQQPAPSGGSIVQWPWFKYYDRPPAPQYGDRIIQSVDPGFTTNEGSSCTACLTFLCREDRFYLLDVFRGKMEFPELMRFVPAFADKWQAGIVVLEDSGAGKALIQAVHQLDRRRYRWLRPTAEKQVRLLRVSPYIENGRVFLPKQAPWLDKFRHELLAFPNGKHDDQVDALSQFLTAYLALRNLPWGFVADGQEPSPGSRVSTFGGMPDLSIPDLFNMRVR